MSEVRRGAYFFEFGTVLVPPRVAAVLLRQAGIERWWRQVDVRGQDAQVDEVVVSLIAAAAAWRARAGSDLVPSSVPAGSETSELGCDDEPELTVAEVVDRNIESGGCPLGERAVRKAALDGRLPGRVRHGRWSFRLGDVDRWLAARNTPNPEGANLT